MVFHEVVLTSEKFMRDLCVIEPMWFAHARIILKKHDLHSNLNVSWDRFEFVFVD